MNTECMHCAICIFKALIHLSPVIIPRVWGRRILSRLTMPTIKRILSLLPRRVVHITTLFAYETRDSFSILIFVMSTWTSVLPLCGCSSLFTELYSFLLWCTPSNTKSRNAVDKRLGALYRVFG